MAMTKPEFHAACKRHGLTVAEFAAEFGVAESTCYQWGARAGVPRWAVKVLAIMDQHGASILINAASRSRQLSALPSSATPSPRPIATSTPPHTDHPQQNHPPTPSQRQDERLTV